MTIPPGRGREGHCFIITNVRSRVFEQFNLLSPRYPGSRVAEWSGHRTCNLAVPGLSSVWPLAGFVLGCSEFISSASLVNSQLVASCQMAFLILLCSIWIICF